MTRLEGEKVEGKPKDGVEGFYYGSDVRNQSCAKIIEEARHSLKTFASLSPFTPEKTHFFGNAFLHLHDKRPRSTFSLYTRNFEVSLSRPSSGMRLSPLEYKPKLSLSMDKGNNIIETNLHKPPAESMKSSSVMHLSVLKNNPRFCLSTDEDIMVESKLHKPAAEPMRKQGRPSSIMCLSPLEYKTKLSLSVDKDKSVVERNVQKPPAEPMRKQGRPSSMMRLSPLEYKSKLSLSINEDESVVETNVQKPPAEPRKRQSRPSSVMSLSSLEYNWTSKSNHSLKQPKPPADHVERRHRKAAYTRHFKVRPSFRTQHLKEATCIQTDVKGSDDSYGSVLWKTEVVPFLQNVEAVVAGGSVTQKTVEHLCSACTHLFNVLCKKGLLKEQFKKKAYIQQVLFRLVDLGSDKLNLIVAKLMLALNISGDNLLKVCKLIFKISWKPKNVFLFKDNSIIDYLLLLLKPDDLNSIAEAVLYSVASLKLLSKNSDLSRMLLDKNVTHVLLQLSQKLIQLNDLKAEHELHAIKDILVQLTATLRNMASTSQTCCAFLANDVFSTLCAVVRQYQNDQNICLNVARTFSKLSSYAECCYALAETPRCYGLFLDLLSKHDRKQDLVLHLLFTLGNLAAECDEARKRLYEEEGSIEILLGLFQTYQQAALTPRNPQDPQSSLHKEEDVLIKLIRTLANLSIHPDAGTALAANMLCVKLLLEVMEVISVEKSPELVVNATATINNLSYYQAESSVVHVQHERISKLLLRLLLSSNMDAVLEATRVFGNLSQIKEVQQFIFGNKVHKIIVVLLDSKNVDLCYAACGVLVNLSKAEKNRSKLQKEGAICSLINCLQHFGGLSWELAGLVCQALWNCMDDGEEYTKELLEILSLYIDKEALQWPSDVDEEHYKACWELEFLPVAQRLEKRIQSCLIFLETIGESSEYVENVFSLA